MYLVNFDKKEKLVRVIEQDNFGAETKQVLAKEFHAHTLSYTQIKGNNFYMAYPYGTLVLYGKGPIYTKALVIEDEDFDS